MILIFVLLERLSLKINVHSRNYFYPFQGLTYGFEKNAVIYYGFFSFETQMVFGLATNKELKEIESKGDSIEYCEGKHNLSKIQFFVVNRSAFTRNITKRMILTPYVFACNTSYNFQLELEYFNGKGHSDYRSQDAIIYTLFFASLIFIFEVLFIIYIIKVKEERKRGYHLLLHMYFCSIFIVLLFSSINFILMKKYEYLTDKFDPIYPEALTRVFTMTTFVSLICFHFFMTNYSAKNVFGCLFFYLTEVISFSFSIALIMRDTNYYFLPHCLYLSTCIAEFIIPIKMSLTRIGLLIFFIGYYLIFVIKDNYSDDYMNYSHKLSSTIRLNAIFVAIAVSSAVLFMIGYIFLQDWNLYDDNSNNTNSIIHHINYTDAN